MADDVVWTKKCVATWQHVGVQVCVYTCMCARVRMYVCAHMHACEERDKLPFQDNAISLMCTYNIYARLFFIFCNVGHCLVLNTCR